MIGRWSHKDTPHVHIESTFREAGLHPLVAVLLSKSAVVTEYLRFLTKSSRWFLWLSTADSCAMETYERQKTAMTLVWEWSGGDSSACSLNKVSTSEAREGGTRRSKEFYSCPQKQTAFSFSSNQAIISSVSLWETVARTMGMWCWAVHTIWVNETFASFMIISLLCILSAAKLMKRAFKTSTRSSERRKPGDAWNVCCWHLLPWVGQGAMHTYETSQRGKGPGRALRGRSGQVHLELVT